MTDPKPEPVDESVTPDTDLRCPRHGSMGDLRFGFVCGCWVRWGCGRFYDCDWHRARWRAYMQYI